MSAPGTDMLETILRQCATSAPRPWYPRDYAEATGTPRADLDPFLERLRLAGLIHLTDWVQGPGQGYALTLEGEHVLREPRLLRQLRSGSVPAMPQVEPREPGPRSRGATAYDRGEAIRAALLGQADPVVTYVLIALNVLVFLAGLYQAAQHNALNNFLAQGDPRILNLIGAVSTADVVRGQWWRLLTNCFVHFGALHLGFNMMALYNVGPLLERLLGRWRYLLLYLIAGFGGSCVGIIAQPGLLAGASGAICGLLGALASWAILNRAFLPPPFFASLKRYLVTNAVLLVIVSMFPGVSWSAHLGGAVFGFVAAALLNVQRFGSPVGRILAMLALLTLPFLGVGGLVYARKVDPRWGIAELTMAERDILPAAGRAEKAAEDAYADAADLIHNHHATRRPPAQVEKAVAELDGAQTQLNEVTQRLRGVHYATARAEEMRAACLDYLDGWNRWCELASRCLKAGEDCTPQDEKVLKEQKLRIDELGKRCEKVIKE